MNDEFYNKEFPNSFNDFVYLGREFTREEIQRADKDALIELCVELKRKELQYYIERNELQNTLDSQEPTLKDAFEAGKELTAHEWHMDEFHGTSCKCKPLTYQDFETWMDQINDEKIKL